MCYGNFNPKLGNIFYFKPSHRSDRRILITCLSVAPTGAAPRPEPLQSPINRGRGAPRARHRVVAVLRRLAVATCRDAHSRARAADGRC
jgi:hypothetical protein